MSSDQELQAWMADWAAGADTIAAPETIRTHVRRRTRLLAAWMTGELVITTTIGAFLVHRAVTHPDATEQLTMALLATIAVAALAFSAVNWRGAWRPSADTTAQFLELSRDRARRLRRAASAGWILLAAEAAVFVPWVWLRAGTRWQAWLFLGAMLGSGAFFLARIARWARREDDLLADLARELGGPL